jgi:CRP-like cAMP-binding protein
MDRPSRSKDTVGLDQLIARKNWRQAIDLLRKQILKGETPSIQGRLQLADCLALDGRDREAVPILLGLADELAAEGFIARSIAILKRVEKLEPERADMTERLARLAREQIRLTPVVTPPMHAASLRTAPSSEETRGDDARHATPIDAAQTGDERSELFVEQLLHKLSPGHASPSTTLADSNPNTTKTTPSKNIDLLMQELVRRLSPDDTLPPLHLAHLRLDVLGATELETSEPDAEGSSDLEPLSDEAFHQQLLDLIKDVLQRPITAKLDEQEPAQDAALASRLLATPLLGGLSAEELSAVVQGLELRIYEPGDAIVTEGERSRSLFVLTHGRAKVFVRSRDGHAVEVDELLEGDFFGEIAVLSGMRRAATVTASTPCEVLELEKTTLDAIALTHPQVRETLEAAYVRNVGDPDATAVRSVELGLRDLPRRAIAELESHFGASEWHPRMRLRLADVLFRSGKQDAAVPILARLAEELAHGGYPAKAIALVKKIEMIQKRHIQEIPLAPLARSSVEGDSQATSEKDRMSRPERRPGTGSPAFEQWLVRLAREAVEKRRGQKDGSTDSPSRPPRGYAPGLIASPLFENIGDDDFLALAHNLRLLSYQAGDIIVSEGEPGESVYVLASGSAKVLVREPGGRSVTACRLEEGAFFGEIAALSGRPRSATVVACTPCDLLELDRKTLDAITTRHPRVREVLETYYIERASDPTAERIRTVSP